MCVFMCVLSVGWGGGGWTYNTAAVLLLTVSVIIQFKGAI